MTSVTEGRGIYNEPFWQHHINFHKIRRIIFWDIKILWDIKNVWDIKILIMKKRLQLSKIINNNVRLPVYAKKTVTMIIHLHNNFAI